MPYVITTRKPVEDTPINGWPATRRAVATLDEVRRYARDFCDDRYAYYGRYHADANAIPRTGGTVGPLPDGTTIEVRRVRFDIWHDEDGVWGTELGAIMGRALGPFGGETEAEVALVAAFNEAQD